MKRFHVHVSVPDLDSSIRFYSTLFGTEPAVVKGDYAKWMLEDPRVNFAISQRGGKPGLNHLGLQTDSDGELEVAERAAATSRPFDACREGDGLLLCALEQVLGHRPHRHCLGDVPHAWRGPDLQRRRRDGIGRRRRALLHSGGAHCQARKQDPGEGRGRLLQLIARHGDQRGTARGSG